jgi:predicted amidohydrolase
MSHPILPVSIDEPSTVRVAMCQVYTEEWAVEANSRRLLESLHEARRQGADLAITPECVLHGYGFAEPEVLQQRLSEVAEPLDGPNILRVRECAKELGLDVIVGFAEKAETGEVYNSAAFLSREGEVLSVYRKVHCRSFESVEHQGAFTPGDAFFVSSRQYNDSDYRIGTFICFDREVAEAARCLRSLGAQLIACPLATNTFDMAHPENRADNEMITRCRAAENEVFIVVVNHAGRFNGGSFAVGPRGELYAQLGAEPEVHVLDLPVGIVAGKFHGDPLGWMGWGYRRPDVYNRYLAK